MFPDNLGDDMPTQPLYGVPYMPHQESFGQEVYGQIELATICMLVIHLIRNIHKHVTSAIIVAISAPVAFLALMNSNYGSNDLVWVFWSAILITFLAAIKLAS